MDEEIEVNVVEKPTLESLSDGERSALCAALFLTIQDLIKEEN